jgi:diguanylate cyclase (GGDEF)-like protein
MRYYVFTFIVIYELIAGVYFYTLYVKNIDKYNKQTIELIGNAFKSVINGYEMMYDDSYSEQSDKLSNFVYMSNGATTQKRDEIRKNLLSGFMNYFNSKKLNSLNAFEVFDATGKTLIRFNQPKYYDDNATKKRLSLVKLQQKLSYQKGFDFDISQESYYFAYPLFHDGNFVGSYMYGVDLKALVDEMHKIYGQHYQILLKSEFIEKNLQQKQIENSYKKLQIASKNFYIKKSLYNPKPHKQKIWYLIKLQEFQKALTLQKPSIISYKYDAIYYTMAIIPLKDINDQNFAYMLVNIKTSQLHHYKNILYLELFFIMLFGFMLYLYIIKEIKNREYARKLINLQRDLIIVTNGKVIKDTNDAFLDFFNYKTLDDFKQEHKCICNLFVKEDGYIQEKASDTTWIEYVQKHPEKEHRVKFLSKKGEERTFMLEIKRIDDSNTFFILFRDITDDLKIKAKLEARANFDSLTGIFNRSRFEFFLNRELKTSNRYGGVFSLIMFDIDRFKEINDAYGHDVGDIILKELTSLVSTHVRDIDIFARWGGEEFMIISKIDIDEAIRLSQKLRHMIESYNFTTVEKLTCSFGVTQYKENDTKMSIVKRCDDALYRAKESGRNRVVTLDFLAI